MFTSSAGAGRPGRARHPHSSRRLLTAGATLAAVLAVAPATAFAADVHVSTGGLDSETCGPAATPCQTIQTAHDHAVDGDVIRVAAGTYNVAAGTDIFTSVQIVGAGKGQTVIRPSGEWTSDAVFTLTPPSNEEEEGDPPALNVEFADLTIEGPSLQSDEQVAGVLADAWDATINLSVKNAEFVGGSSVFSAVTAESNAGAVTLDAVTVRGNGASELRGFGVQLFGQSGPVTVQNSSFTLGGPSEGQFEGLPSTAIFSLYGPGALKVTGNTIVSPVGVLHAVTPADERNFRAAAAELAPISEITGNRITAYNAWAGVLVETVSWLDFAASEAPISAAAALPPAVIDGNVIDGVQPPDGGAEYPSGLGGISAGGTAIDARVTRNSVSGFGIGVAELHGEDGAPRVTVTGNRIVGNDIGLYAPQFDGTDRAALNATNNWWGCNSGPGAKGCDIIETTEIEVEETVRSGRADAPDGSVDATPHLVFGVTATPKALAAAGTAAVTASLTTNSDGDKADAVFGAIAGTPAVSFTATQGTVDASAPLAAGSAKASFRSTAGEGRSVKGSFDNASDTFSFTDVEKAPQGEEQPKPVPPVVDLNAPGLTDEQQRVLGYSTMMQCRKTPIVVFGVSLVKNRAVVTGLTSPKFAGKQVQLQFKPTGKKVVAKATIATDGSYTVSTRAPKGELRDSDEARYRVRVPGAGTSPWLKLTRRLNVPTFKLDGRELTIKGKLAGPFERGQEVVVSRRQACGPTKVLARLKANGKGRFGGTVTLGPNSTISTIRMTAKVIGKETDAPHRTYSLSQPVLVR